MFRVSINTFSFSATCFCSVLPFQAAHSWKGSASPACASASSTSVPRLRRCDSTRVCTCQYVCVCVYCVCCVRACVVCACVCACTCSISRSLCVHQSSTFLYLFLIFLRLWKKGKESPVCVSRVCGGGAARLFWPTPSLPMFQVRAGMRAYV